MYDIFIYTGESPINTPGMGLGYLLSKIRGLHDKPQEDEEKGRTAQSAQTSDTTQVDHEGLVLSDKDHGGQPGAVEEVHTINMGYDQSHNGSEEPQDRVSCHESRLQKKLSKDTNYDASSHHERQNN